MTAGPGSGSGPDDARPAYDPLPVLARVRASAARVVATVAAMTPADCAAPSLLPGWTRGHVCAHLEANASSLVNLLTWARTGVETPQYASPEARDAFIEAHAGRSPAEHAAAMAAADDALADAVRAMPADAWSTVLTWRGGATRPASAVLGARLQETEIHHVDLGLAYAPAHWHDDFTTSVLDNVATAFGRREPVPAFDLLAVDSERRWQLGPAPAPTVVQGPQAALLAWVTGRSAGDGLVAHGADGAVTALPVPPTWL